MEDVERLLKGTVEELGKLLNGKNVLGDPIEKGDAVIVPIVSYGFAFGAGGADSSAGGSSGGTGAGGGIKPLGAIIVDKDGARVEGVHGTATEIAQMVADAASKVIDRATKGATKAGKTA